MSAVGVQIAAVMENERANAYLQQAAYLEGALQKNHVVMLSLSKTAGAVFVGAGALGAGTAVGYVLGFKDWALVSIGSGFSLVGLHVGASRGEIMMKRYIEKQEAAYTDYRIRVTQMYEQNIRRRVGQPNTVKME